MNAPARGRYAGLLGVLMLGVAVLTAGCGAAEEASGTPREAPSSRGSSGSSGPGIGVPPSSEQPGTGSVPSTSPSRTPESRDAPDLPDRRDLPTLPEAGDPGPVEGADASWPQCPTGMGIPEKQGLGAPMPFDSAEFVVLGLTNGPGFTPNPCLEQQGRWVKDRQKALGAYAVLSYPEPAQLWQYGDDGPHDASTRPGQLANVGYQQALFTLGTLRDAGLRVPAVWVDVEPVPDFEWSDDLAANAAVVEGAVRAYRDRGYDVGVYSTQHLWSEVVGDLQLGLREWRAAGQTSRAEALRRCGSDAMFQGGSPVMTQWVEAGRDRNVTCPGEALYLDLWFQQY